jgi:hypothetical protein
VSYHCHHWIGIQFLLIGDVTSAKVRVKADTNESNTGLFTEVMQVSRALSLTHAAHSADVGTVATLACQKN